MSGGASSRPATTAEPPAPPTLEAALRAASARLGAAGCDTPRLDAEVLLAHALGVDRARLVLDARAPLADAGAAARFAGLVARREAREPVAYLTGRRGFRRLELAVDRRALVPRPETETLVEAALEVLPTGARVVDVGTGTGAIALALADERPDLTVLATEADPDTAALARENAARLGLPVTVLDGDLLDPVLGAPGAVLANLPYVAEPDRRGLPAELAHEPPGALFAGPDGLDAIRRLVAASAARRVPRILLEVGAGQAPAVARLIREAGLARTRSVRDLAGIERVVVGERA